MISKLYLIMHTGLHTTCQNTHSCMFAQCWGIKQAALNEAIILHLHAVQCIGVKCSTGGNTQIRPPFDHHLRSKPETFGHSACRQM